MAPRAEETVATVVTPCVEALGLEVFDVEMIGRGRTRTLRVLVDRAGGVDLDAITAAAEAVGHALDDHADVDRLLAGSYTLEVSSPGVERTLRRPAHFRGAIGSAISIKTRDASGTPARRHAVLTAADDDGVEIEVDGTRERLAYDAIEQARTVFEWGRADKPGRANRPAAAR